MAIIIIGQHLNVISQSKVQFVYLKLIVLNVERLLGSQLFAWAVLMKGQPSPGVVLRFIRFLVHSNVT